MTDDSKKREKDVFEKGKTVLNMGAVQPPLGKPKKKVDPFASMDEEKTDPGGIVPDATPMAKPTAGLQRKPGGPTQRRVASGAKKTVMGMAAPNITPKKSPEEKAREVQKLSDELESLKEVVRQSLPPGPMTDDDLDSMDDYDPNDVTGTIDVEAAKRDDSKIEFRNPAAEKPEMDVSALPSLSPEDFVEALPSVDPGVPTDEPVSPAEDESASAHVGEPASPAEATAGSSSHAGEGAVEDPKETATSSSQTDDGTDEEDDEEDDIPTLAMEPGSQKHEAFQKHLEERMAAKEAEGASENGPAPKKSGGGGKMILVLFVLLLLGGGAYYLLMVDRSLLFNETTRPYLERLGIPTDEIAPATPAEEMTEQAAVVPTSNTADESASAHVGKPASPAGATARSSSHTGEGDVVDSEHRDEAPSEGAESDSDTGAEGQVADSEQGDGSAVAQVEEPALPAGAMARSSIQTGGGDAAGAIYFPVRFKHGSVTYWFADKAAEDAFAQKVLASSSGRQVIVTGYVTPREKEEKMGKLARSRAWAVQKHLQRMGVPADSISADRGDLSGELPTAPDQLVVITFE